MSQPNYAFEFNANGIAPSQARPLFPVGWYLAEVSDGERKNNAANTGELLELFFTLKAGRFAGGKTRGNYNFNNPSAEAMRIANADISAICHATGVMQFNDVRQLFTRQLEIKLGQEEYKGEMQNKIVGYRAVGSSATPADNGGNAPAAGGLTPPTIGMPPAPAPGAVPQFGAPPAFTPPQAPPAFAPPPVQAAPPAFAPPAPPVQAAPPPPPAAAPTLSPDGQWRLENGAWVPNVQAAPQPPAAAPAPAQVMPWNQGR